MERAMQSGFLLHRKGTPVHSFLVLMAQWSGGFVKMASEWRTRVGARPTISVPPFIVGHALLQGWPTGQPANTACKQRLLQPYKLGAAADVDAFGGSSSGYSLDGETIKGLVGRSLHSIDVDSFLVPVPNGSIVAAVPAAGAAGYDSASASALPFDVSLHPSAQSFVAKSMLKRMSDDTREYAAQEAQRKTWQLKGISSENLARVARECDASAVVESVVRLNELHAQLSLLRQADWASVQQLRVLVERMANEVPGLIASADGKQQLSLAAVQFALSRYNGQSFTVKMDYLTALMLSSQPEKDILELNPHLPTDSLSQLLLLLPTLLLLTNRVGLVDRLLFDLDNMRASLRSLERKSQSVRAVRPLALARSLSGGTQLVSVEEQDDANTQQDASIQAMSELEELAQQIGIQSTTLADSLLSARHYMEPQSQQADGSTTVWAYDPRFLVFEYIFNILLRRMQVDLIRSFAQAGWTKRSITEQMIMGAGKTTVSCARRTRCCMPSVCFCADLPAALLLCVRWWVRCLR